ncbi:MAG: hypothetical protein WBQ17_15440 [Rhizomicrobium sp.]
MRNRLLKAGFAVVALITGFSAAYAADDAGVLAKVSLAAVAPVPKLAVPCANAFDAAGDACRPTSDALFPASLASAAPIAVLSDGAGAIKLTDELDLNFGGATLAQQPLAQLQPFSGSMREEAVRPLAQASFAGVSWNVARGASLSLIAAQSTANDPFEKPALNSLAKSQRAVSAGASAELGSNWVTTISYGQGTSQLNLRSGNLLGDDDLLHSHTLALSIAKRGLFGNNDSLDIGIARKLQSYTPNIDFSGGDGLDTGPLPKSNALTVPETDFEVGYVTTFLDGALALQANAGYQANVYGQNGQNALTVLSRAKFNF